MSETRVPVPEPVPAEPSASASPSEPPPAAPADPSALAAALQAAEQRALIAERLLARGSRLPAPYRALVTGSTPEEIDSAIEAAEAQWAQDVRSYASSPANIGAAPQLPSPLPPTRRKVEAALAERMRYGDPAAFREYRQLRLG